MVMVLKSFFGSKIVLILLILTVLSANASANQTLYTFGTPNKHYGLDEKTQTISTFDNLVMREENGWFHISQKNNEKGKFIFYVEGKKVIGGAKFESKTNNAKQVSATQKNVSGKREVTFAFASPNAQANIVFDLNESGMKFSNFVQTKEMILNPVFVYEFEVQKKDSVVFDDAEALVHFDELIFDYSDALATGFELKETVVTAKGFKVYLTKKGLTILNANQKIELDPTISHHSNYGASYLHWEGNYYEHYGYSWGRGESLGGCSEIWRPGYRYRHGLTMQVEEATLQFNTTSNCTGSGTTQLYNVDYSNASNAEEIYNAPTIGGVLANLLYADEEHTLNVASNLNYVINNNIEMLVFQPKTAHTPSCSEVIRSGRLSTPYPDITFSYKNNADLNTVQPSGGEYLTDTITISFVAHDSNNTDTNASIYYSTSKGAQTNLIANPVLSTTPSGSFLGCTGDLNTATTCSYSWTVSNVPNGIYYIDVQTNNPFGYLTASSANSFELNKIDANVVYPAGGETFDIYSTAVPFKFTSNNSDTNNLTARGFASEAQYGFETEIFDLNMHDAALNPSADQNCSWSGKGFEEEQTCTVLVDLNSFFGAEEYIELYFDLNVFKPDGRYGTDSSDKWHFKSVFDLDLWFFDEKNLTPLQPNTLTINGTSYAGDVDTNGLLTLTHYADSDYNIIANHTNYTERTWLYEQLSGSDHNISLVLLQTALGTNLEFDIYKPDQVTKYSNAIVDLNLSGKSAGRKYTNANGELTFFVDPTQTAYILDINNSEQEYKQTTVLVKKPISQEDMNTTITPFNVKVTGATLKTQNNNNDDVNVIVFNNTAEENVFIADINSDYYSATKTFTFIGDTDYWEWQPYIVPTGGLGVEVAVYTINNPKNRESLPGVTVESWYEIDGVLTLLERKTSDGTGTTLMHFVLGQRYVVRAYYEGELVGEIDYEPATTSLFIFVGTGTFTETDPVGFVQVQWYNSPSVYFTETGFINVFHIVTPFASNLGEIKAIVTHNNETILTRTWNAGGTTSDYNVSYQLDLIGRNQYIPFIVNLRVYDTNGTLIYDQNASFAFTLVQVFHDTIDAVKTGFGIFTSTLIIILLGLLGVSYITYRRLGEDTNYLFIPFAIMLGIGVILGFIDTLPYLNALFLGTTVLLWKVKK
jgi:hypothetical protein